MRYSLQSHFRGALLGAALGEILGFQCQIHRQNKSSLNWQRVEQWSFKPLETMPSWSYGRVVVDGIRQLIERHRWDIEMNSLKAAFNPYESPSADMPVKKHTSRQSSPPAGIIAILPIALYFHDDLPQLRYQIRQAIALWYPTVEDDELYLCSLVVAYAIALSLQHRWQPQQLIAELVEDLELNHHSQPLTQVLRGVEDAIAAGIGFSRLMQTVGRTDHSSSAALTSVAIALWSLLNTPDHGRLSMLQAARFHYQPQLVCALVGALSGAYNGVSGLPLRWRSALHQQPTQTSALLTFWDVASEEAVLHLADQLVAGWAGVYQTPLKLPSNGFSMAIAAPDVIRPR